MIHDNIIMAKDKSQPLCQDTGTIICYADLPALVRRGDLHARPTSRAVVEATRVGYLRQNSVDSITGQNSGNNLGPGSPGLPPAPDGEEVASTVRMMLKGGGCENVGIQYSLPDTRLGAGRDLDGVRRCLLDAVLQAQGKGCGPGILGVCIGGDRGTGYVAAKEEFFRELDDTNEDPRLAKLEKQIMKEANSLGIGPMGFGGATTLLGVKITHRNRLPASFFVSVSYMCWAFRRNGFVLARKREALALALRLLGGSIMLLEAPFTEEKIRALKVGDMVEITGLLFTGRDAVHKYLHDGGKPPVDLTRQHHLPLRAGGGEGGGQVGGQGRRPDHQHPRGALPGTADGAVRIRGVIGKGGMGPKTLEYCRKVGAVYFHAIGGAAQVLAERVVEVTGVHLAEGVRVARGDLGVPGGALPGGGDHGLARTVRCTRRCWRNRASS